MLSCSFFIQSKDLFCQRTVNNQYVNQPAAYTGKTGARFLFPCGNYNFGWNFAVNVKVYCHHTNTKSDLTFLSVFVEEAQKNIATRLLRLQEL